MFINQVDVVFGNGVYAGRVIIFHEFPKLFFTNSQNYFPQIPKIIFHEFQRLFPRIPKINFYEFKRFFFTNSKD